jgi:hypothetical protein
MVLYFSKKKETEIVGCFVVVVCIIYIFKVAHRY